jgi:hypothetical protein
MKALLPPSPIPLSARAGSQPVKKAYCPILAARGRRKMCTDVRCGECVYLSEHLGDEAVEWLCSTCSGGRTTMGHWKDGACDGCGGYSIVLALARA